MIATFLGTGTSSGVPAIGCRCTVCCSGDPRNTRRRSSLYVQAAGRHLVVDTPPDFREQVLTFGVPRVDAVCITHAHADHIFGLDDIRRFNEVQKESIPVFGAPATVAALERFFPYVRQPARPGLSYPRVEFRAITGPFQLGALRVEPIPVEHAGLDTLGFRLDADGQSLAYIPDCHGLDDAAAARLTGLDCLILDALRPTPHPTHFTLAESLAVLRRLGARQSWITHMSHHLDYETTRRGLPPGVGIPYDGLALDVGTPPPG